jgi:hypothetical protein
VFFNDAGIGKDEAGIAALTMLEDSGVPAACISHNSARIGDAQDMWDHGLISRVNQLAETAGIGVGEKLSLAALHFVGKSSTE